VAQGPAGTRVAITGAGQGGVFRHTGMEAALTRAFAAESLRGIQTPTEGLINDMHASAAYRAHLIGVMARRAVAGA
jgi:carbon-monoxide dehydrogenase medium subunit